MGLFGTYHLFFIKRSGDYWEMFTRSGDYTSVVGITSAFACYLKIRIIIGLHNFLGNKNKNNFIYYNICLFEKELLSLGITN